jgi:hypothetical protein
MTELEIKPKPETLKLCTFCSKPFTLTTLHAQEHLPFIPTILSCINNTDDELVYFNNKPYHRVCLSRYHSDILKNDFDDLIEVNNTYKMSELLSIVNDIYPIHKNPTTSKCTKDFMYKIMDIICNHNTDYIKCSNPNCKRLLLRERAIVGVKTKTFQMLLVKQQSESQITPDDKEYQQNSPRYKVLYFCSPQCDGYFSSKLRYILENIIKDANNKVENVRGKIKSTLDVYESSKSRTQAEKDKIKNILSAQERAKIKIINEQAVMLVKKTTKEWIG